MARDMWCGWSVHDLAVMLMRSIFEFQLSIFENEI